MKTFTNLPTSGRTRRFNGRRRGNPRTARGGFLRLPLSPPRVPTRDLVTALEQYTVTDGTKYGLAVCPCCDEMVAVFVRSRGQLLCLECADTPA